MRTAIIVSLLALGMVSTPAWGKEPPQPSFAPQRPFAECVADAQSLLALSFEDFDQGVQPVAGGPREEWGWRPIARQPGCETAAADLISQWRARHGEELPAMLRSFMAFHEAQVRAGGGDHAAAIALIEESAQGSFGDEAWQAYVAALLAFLQHDREALLAARERLLAVPEPDNWAERQRQFREEAGQEMAWPRNIEATDTLVACFGKAYPLWGKC